MSPTGRVALIIGHRGQDGTLLRERLEAEGTAVVGIGRPGVGHPAADEPIDVGDAGALAAFVTSVLPTEIYYLAGHHGSSETMSLAGSSMDIAAAWGTHVAGFQSVLDAVQLTVPQIPVLLAASSLIYAPSDDLIDESSSLGPDTVYGLTKAAAVLLARERQRQGQLVHTLNLFPHESGLRHESFVASKIVRTGLRIAAGSEERLTIGEPDAMVDWSLARDVAAAMVDVVRMDKPQELLVANGRAFSVHSLASEVFAQLGLDIDQHLDVRPAVLKRPSTHRIASPQRLRKQLPWWPELDVSALATGLINEHREVNLKENRSPK